ncbi:dihydrolipoamide acetyltransferase family protein [Nocardiopsis sediminis]|uniref:Dihydrolipoamide acetyltransferase component of pyruvate dehydrogenase complex n=1 Tax=Nocardiopsis sediminis TaxID=1778267 RepID=A0ABV8FHR2_9ACTN
MSGGGAVRGFLLPDLGEGLTEAEILTWLVAVGDTVAVDQPVAEVETAKAAVEVPCPFAGTVAALHGAPGDSVAVGAPLISIDTSPAESAAGSAEPGTVVPAARPAPGAEGAGADRGGSASQGDLQGSGAVLVGYGTGRDAHGRQGRRRRARTAEGPRTTASAAPSAPPAQELRTPVVSPLVRRLAREHGVDVTALAGSGGGGLVLRRDVEAALAAGRDPAPAAVVPAESLDGGGMPDGGERIPLRGARRTAAERLTRSRREIPEATVWVDADASGLLDLRATLNAADPGRPVGILALVARFCLLGLRRYPSLNSRVDPERAELVRFSHVNLGFAAQTPQGLVVPVLHGAHALTTRELSAELDGAAERARGGALSPRDLTGGTFTVNNYGVFGVDGSAAIINHPEAAIVGIGRIVKRPWVVEDRVAVRPVVELTLAFDHRVCDGEEAGGFLRFVADCVERPGIALGDL